LAAFSKPPRMRGRMGLIAYLDAGTGSMLMQALAGGVAGVAVVGKLYWSRLKRVFSRRPPGDEIT
jgi:hypothetical protein